MTSMSQSSWLFALILSVLFSLLLGLVLVWLSIERTDKAYAIRQLRGSVEEHRVLRSKLEIERDRLLAPQILREKAAKLGMGEAKAGQIRRMIDVKAEKKQLFSFGTEQTRSGLR